MLFFYIQLPQFVTESKKFDLHVLVSLYDISRQYKIISEVSINQVINLQLKGFWQEYCK